MRIFSPLYRQTPDTAYRAATCRVGLALLSFLFFGTFFSTANQKITVWAGALFPFNEDTLYVFERLLNSTTYILTLTFSTLILRLLLSKKERLERPMLLKPILPKHVGLYIFAGLAVVFTAVTVNRFITRWIPGTDILERYQTDTTIVKPITVATLYFTTAIVPALFEELFFRGALLSVLSPFGDGIAVIGSAFAFGLAHQTPDQILYATVAGFLFGYLALKTDSIWCGFLIHFFNNLLSVVHGVLFTRYENAVANHLYAILSVAVIGLGLLSLMLLLGKNGLAYRKTPVKLSPSHPILHFLSLPMLAYILLTVYEIANTIYLYVKLSLYF